MSMKSVGIVFLVMLVGLFGTFCDFLHSTDLPFGQMLTFAVVGVTIAVLMGFFVAAACAYMADLIGTSSSPISGIGILGIIVSSLIILTLCNFFGIFAMPNGETFATAIAIFTTSIILSIACISNDNMQDLKTGYLVGATPWRQQAALLLGCVVGAFVIAPVLNLLYEAYGFPGALPRPDMNPDAALAAPQASLMTMIAQGIFSSQMAWEYIYIGMGLGVLLVLVNFLLQKNTTSLCLPPLAVGIGIYLPPSVQTPLVVGAVMGYFLDKWLRRRTTTADPVMLENEIQEQKRKGTLFASGLIVGESLIGVLLAALIVVSVSNGGSDSPLTLITDEFAAGIWPELLGFVVFAAMIVYFCRVVLHKN